MSFSKWLPLNLIIPHLRRSILWKSIADDQLCENLQQIPHLSMVTTGVERPLGERGCLTQRHLKHAPFLSLRPLPPYSTSLGGSSRHKDPGQGSPPTEPEHNCERSKKSRPERTGNACVLGQPELFPPAAQSQLACIKSPFPNVNLVPSFGNLLVSFGEPLSSLLEALSAFQQLVR